MPRRPPPAFCRPTISAGPPPLRQAASTDSPAFPWLAFPAHCDKTDAATLVDTRAPSRPPPDRSVGGCLHASRLPGAPSHHSTTQHPHLSRFSVTTRSRKWHRISPDGHHDHRSRSSTFGLDTLTRRFV